MVERSGLIPFDSERARAAGLRSAESRRAAKLAGKLSAEGASAELRQFARTWQRDDLAPLVFAAAAELVGRTLRGEIPVRNGAELAEVLRVLVDIGRLETGDATRTVAVAHLSGPALAERIRQLQRADPVSAAALVADDGPDVGTIDVGTIDVEGLDPPG
jgi:hypothetical protein